MGGGKDAYLRKSMRHKTGYRKVGSVEALREAVSDEVRDLYVTLQGPVKTEEELQGLVELLGGNPENLKGLDLSGRDLGVERTRELADVLKRNDVLQELYLSGNRLGAEGASVVAEMLRENKGLRKLDLYNNGIADVKDLAAVIEGHNTLWELDLSNNLIGEQSGVLLGEAMAKNRKLRRLNLWNNGVGDEGANAFAAALKTNSTLQDLDLFFNNISSQGSAKLTEALSANKGLRVLNLGRNELGRGPGVQLAKSLASNQATQLREMDLFGACIGDKGTKALCEAILSGEHFDVRKLSLARNEITANCSKILAKLITETPLQALNLTKNSLGKGLRDIALALQGGDACLEKLFLIDNMGGKVKDVTALERAEIGTAFVEAVFKPSSLEAVDLSNNKFGSECEVLVRKLVATKDVAGKHAVAHRVLFRVPLLPDDAPDAASCPMCTRCGACEACTRKVEAPSVRERCGTPVMCLQHAPETAPCAPEPCEDGQDGRRCFLHNKEQLLVGAEDAEGFGRVQRLVWAKSAFRLGKQNMVLFVHLLNLAHSNMLDLLQNRQLELAGEADIDEARPAQLIVKLWSDQSLWLAHDPASRQPMAHCLFEQSQSVGVAALCQFLDLDLTVASNDMLALLNAQDDDMRTLRSLALASPEPEVKEWAAAFGTFLDRYQVDDGPPVHVSRTCVVVFATDVRIASSAVNEADLQDARVALKLMRNREDFERELASRSIDVKSLAKKRGIIDAEQLKQTEYKHTLGIKAVHMREQCIIFRRADRSLFEAMHTERIAGHNVLEIQQIASFLGRALSELHASGKVHGDVKPRNILRVSESNTDMFVTTSRSKSQAFNRAALWPESHATTAAAPKRPPKIGELKKKKSAVAQMRDQAWMLIDLDATTGIGESVSEKYSTAYAPPEMADSVYNDRDRILAEPSYDVWSFGVVLYELLTGTPLFLMDKTNDNLVAPQDKAELTNWLVLDEDRLARINTEHPTFAEELVQARHLLMRCLVGNPKERISLDDLLAHPFIKGHELRKKQRQKIASIKRERASLHAIQKQEELEAQRAGASARASAKASAKAPARTPPAPVKEEGKNRTSFVRRLFSSGRKKNRAAKKKAAAAAAAAHHAAPIVEVFSEDDEEVDAAVVDLEIAATSPVASELHNPYDQVSLLHHFFFSHAQKEASAIVKDLYLTCRESRLSSWLDMYATDLTASGMKAGIEQSKVFVFMLTETVLLRPYCVQELLWALDAKKQILFVVEEDERFAQYSDALLPWLSEKEVQSRLKEQEPSEEKVEEKLRSWKENMANLKKSLTSKEWKRVTTGELAKCVAKKERVPYRRRAYESEAMVDAILNAAGVTAPSSLRNSVLPHEREEGYGIARQQSLKMLGSGSNARKHTVYIVCDEGVQDLANVFLESIQNKPMAKTMGSGKLEVRKLAPVVDLGATELATFMDELDADPEFKETTIATTSVLLLVSNGMFDGNKGLLDTLHRFWVESHGRVCVVQQGWSFYGKEQQQVGKDQPAVYNKLFIDTEIMPARTTYAHEREAMVAEAKRRLVNSKTGA